MDNVQYIMLSYDEYCKLDNELTNILIGCMDSIVNCREYGETIQYGFNWINADDHSFISFNDQKHTISVYFGTKGIGQLKTRTGIHTVPQFQCTVFCRLPK